MDSKTMEVFNSSGEPGVAVIEIDNNQAVRLKFQYRINISIIHTTFSTTSKDIFNGNVNSYELGGKDNFGNVCFNPLVNENNSDFSSSGKNSIIIPSVNRVVKSTSVLFDDNLSSIGDAKFGTSNSESESFSKSNISLQESSAPDHNLKVEDDNVLLEMEDEEEIYSAMDREHRDTSFCGTDSPHVGESPGTAACNNEKTSLDSQNGNCNDANDSFPCRICHKEFTSSKALVEHINASTSTIKCLVCKEECSSRAHLMLHDYVAHASRGNLSKKLYKECPLCWEPFFNDSDLVIHIKSKHTQEDLNKCCLCHKNFKSSSDYEVHIDVCKRVKSHRKLIKLNKKLSLKAKGKPSNQRKTRLKSGIVKRKESRSKCRELKKSRSSSINLSLDQTSNEGKFLSTKMKITIKKQDKAVAKLKKAKLNAQYYQKRKEEKLLNKQKEAEEKEAKGDNPALVIENDVTDETDNSWDKTLKCKFCERIFMNMREFNSHYMPMRTKRVCTKCGDRSKSKAEYLLHKCKKEREEGNNKGSRGKRKCPVCEEEVIKRDILKHVMFQHTSEMPYLCCICGIPLESYESWISHCDSNHCNDDESNSNSNKLLKNVSFTSSQSDNEVVCKLCKSHFQSEKDFVHHHKFETIRKMCDICETPTFTEAGYIVHRYLSHGLSPEEHHSVSVPSCYDSLNKNLWEEDRFEQFDEGSPESVRCPCCLVSIITKDLLFHVMEMHTHESPFKCCACENESETLTHYLQHCDFHLGKRTYNNKTPRCLQCDLRFESRRALNSHKQFHQKRCPYCQMEFSSAVFLKIHLQNYHTNEMEACSFCGKLFACSTQLAEHERHHYFSKQSQCTVCGKLIFARNMAKHMRIAHPKSDDDLFFCAVCNKRFRDRHQMEQHQLCHSTDFTHKCDVCKKRFKNAIRLREHAKVHLEKKRLFVCDICGKTCTERYNLQVHMRVHSGTKEFHCPLCNQGFNYNQSLKSHMEKEHNKVSVGPQHFNCTFCNLPFGYIHTLEAHMRDKHGYATTNYGPASQWYP